MRQGQQNRRGRGRSNNRKGQSPLSRSFESNGPDVKIRGTAAHVAEKYISLARDAQSSGDLVMAENYLQHAEHYHRIISVVRDQATANDTMNGNAPGQRSRQPSAEQPSQADGNETENADRVPTAAAPAQQPRASESRSSGSRSSEPRTSGARSSGSRSSEPRRRTPRRTERAPVADAEAAPGTEAQPSTHESFTTGDEPEFLKRAVRRKPRANGDDTASATPAKSTPANAGANED